jgi:hypothetical protein
MSQSIIPLIGIVGFKHVEKIVSGYDFLANTSYK